MNYSLALGGGASRGLAHIGVLKYLEEKNITISEISGTSMGAIIGAGYAMGKTPKEMEVFLSEINFLKLIDLNLKDSLVFGKKVYKKLYEFYGENLIENTKIPLKIVATDVINQEKKVFTSGKIVDGVRASISLPMIFKPFEIDGIKYIDGGLLSNLPVLELDGENIIAVSAVREKIKSDIPTHKKFLAFKIKKGFWSYNYQIFKKTIGTIMLQNEDLSLEIAKLKGKNVILLSPDVRSYEYFEFKKFPQIIKKGYQEAQNILGSKNL